ncbi:MAG: BrnT family toxin [Treponema sp.]|nr:BrnT family toxin [Candidatus Treponema scatequi]
MNLEWDEGKNEINKQKHHVSFETASYVFADPFRLERLDRSENNNREEDSYQTLGMVGDVLFVVYTERNDSYRLISARLADVRERRIYYGDSQETDSGWRKAD